MTARDDDETAWYWLRKIYELLAEPNFLLDWIVPIATTALAVAAIYLAYRSYRAAKESNDQSERFRKEDQDERDLRWRRTFAVDVREWYRPADTYAQYDEQGDPELAKAFRKLVRKTDLAGQDSAKRLLRWLVGQVAERRSLFREMTPKERAIAKHPSRRGTPRGNLDVIDNWIKDPSSVEKHFDAFDAQQQAERVALLETLKAEREAQGTHRD